MSERKYSSDEIVPGRDLGKIPFGVVSLRLGILEMIADFQNKATGHWISIFKGSGKGLTADQRWLVVSVAAFTDSLCTVLHNPVAARQPGQLQVCLLLKDQRTPADSLDVQIDIHFNAVGDMDEGNAAIHAVVLAIESHHALDLP